MENKQQTPQQAYEDSIFDIYNLMAWLETVLDDTPDEIKWPDARSLDKVKDILLATLSLKPGYDTESLEKELTECRIERLNLKDVFEKNKK